MSEISNKNLSDYQSVDLGQVSNDDINETLDDNLNETVSDRLVKDSSEKKKKKKKKNKSQLEPTTDISFEKSSKVSTAETDAKAPLGTSKAVETMFRNALRTELDLIALAATKANIMISLNGIIISALMISGAFIFVSSVAFLVPAGMFMFTAAASIFFAILAASPEKAHYFSGFSKWFKALIKRDAHFRDLRGFLARANRSSDGQVNLLINKDRMQLSRHEYWERMQALMRDRDETYHAMSDQLYWLGQIAARNGKMLNMSYSIFRWGMLFSVLASIVLKALIFFYPAVGTEAAATQLDAAFRARMNASVNFDELDIEGLAYDNRTHSILLGLRTPMAGKSSIIVPIVNSEAMFTSNAAPVFGQPIFLDLNGGGIRSLYFDPVLSMFVIANEINDAAGNKQAQIWTWSGNSKDKPVKIDTPELDQLKNIEAVDSITVNGTIKMVFMADEGDAKKGIHARYVILDYKKFTD